MSWTDKHAAWFKRSGQTVALGSGKTVEVVEFVPQNDEAVLTAWATHFRNHYCCDTQIDSLVAGTGKTKAEFLISIKFPDASAAPGPSIRAGDFGEILVADYLEFILGYWVPRTRYVDKTVRNESKKGSDIIGFRSGATREGDTLAIFESKAQYRGKKAKAKLQEAVNDSAKDVRRKAESLNAIKQRYLETGDSANALRVQRFQDEAGDPYVQIYGAVAHWDSSLFNIGVIQATDDSQHPHQDKLMLLVIRGDAMMDLVHNLYKRAADEA